MRRIRSPLLCRESLLTAAVSRAPTLSPAGCQYNWHPLASAERRNSFTKHCVLTSKIRAYFLTPRSGLLFCKALFLFRFLPSNCTLPILTPRSGQYLCKARLAPPKAKGGAKEKTEVGCCWCIYFFTGACQTVGKRRGTVKNKGVIYSLRISMKKNKLSSYLICYVFLHIDYIPYHFTK